MRTFWTTTDLRARGTSEREIRRALQQARLRRVRKGHLALAEAPEEVVRAVRVGGIATATTASRAHGLWTPPDPVPGTRPFVIDGRRRSPQRLHVAAARSAGRLHDPDDAALPLVRSPAVAVHWTEPSEVASASATRIAAPLLMLEHAFRSLPPERALAILDSALYNRLLNELHLAALAARLPEHLRPVVLAADGRAESGIETIVRFLLRLAGLHVEVQVVITGLGTVDLVVERRLIVECDGREWHDDDGAFDRDRVRDLVAGTRRYRHMRVTFAQVLFGWAKVEAAVFAELGR